MCGRIHRSKNKDSLDSPHASLRVHCVYRQGYLTPCHYPLRTVTRSVTLRWTYKLPFDHVSGLYASRTGSMTDVIPVSNTGVFAWAFGRGPPLPNIRRADGTQGPQRQVTRPSFPSLRQWSSLPDCTSCVGIPGCMSHTISWYFFEKSHTKSFSLFLPARKYRSHTLSMRPLLFGRPCAQAAYTLWATQCLSANHGVIPD